MTSYDISSGLDSSSDEEARAQRPAAGNQAAAPALLERCAGTGTGESGTGAASAAPIGKEEEEGVFEIRDFTTVSSFERLVHQISQAIKRWAQNLQQQTGAAPAPLTADAGEGPQNLHLEFKHADLEYELLFQHAPVEPPGVKPVGTAGLQAATQERLGLHTFPSRAHRLQRWFGVQHFVVLSVRDQSIDLDSARTMLSALVLASKSVAIPGVPALSCFVPVDRSRRRRFVGELLGKDGGRVVYTTDFSDTVELSLEHLSGLLEYFFTKLEVDPDAPGQSLAIGARFTYLADAFDPVSFEDSKGHQELRQLRAAAQLHESGAAALAAAAEASGGSASGSVATAAGAQQSKAAGDGAAPAQDKDPIESIHLYCLWPSFRRHSFTDNASFTELEPGHAPFWKLRVLRTDKPSLPRVQRLRNLLDFRKEASTVRSAEHCVQPQMPKTALASISYAIQESLESILLPTTGEMMELAAACMACAVAGSGDSSADAPAMLSPLRGASSSTRLACLAALAADMRCFKGSVMLWCQVLTQMRRQWDELEAPPAGASPPRTHRLEGSSVRSEVFSGSACRIQQKLEMLQCSIEARRSPLQPAEPTATSLRLQATGEALLDPQLLPPALLTEDMVLQRRLVAAGIPDPSDRAELLGGRELRSDASAFKAANPKAGLEDFLVWRSKVLGLSQDSLPQEWLVRHWDEASPKPAAQQQSGAPLFDAEREAEMALHYLENIEGTPLLIQLFRVLLAATLEELGVGAGSAEQAVGGDLAHLRVLRDRAAAAALAAFGPPKADDATGAVPGASAEVDDEESATFPPEEKLSTLVDTVEALESLSRLATSLQAKFQGPARALLEDLLAEGEATVTTLQQREVVEALFARSRALVMGQDADEARGIFDSLPLSKEFVILLQPDVASSATAAEVSAGDLAHLQDVCPTKRMYAEVRERHMRLAMVRGFDLT